MVGGEDREGKRDFDESGDPEQVARGGFGSKDQVAPIGENKRAVHQAARKDPMDWRTRVFVCSVELNGAEVV